jgi:hypothetical protein
LSLHVSGYCDDARVSWGRRGKWGGKEEKNGESVNIQDRGNGEH